MSIAQLARASSIGIVACPKRTIPARSPSASSSACPSAMPVSSTVWCGPGLEVALHLHVEVEAAVAGHASSRWSKKPTPVERLPSPRPVQVERQADVGLAGARSRCSAVRAHARRSIDSACTGKPSARASAAPARARGAAAAPAGNDTRAMRRRKVAGPSGAREARGAARGKHVVRAGHVVAERRAGVAAHEHAAGGADRVRQRLRLLAHQLEVLRARSPRRSASAAAMSRASHERARRRVGRVGAAAASATASSSRRLGGDQPRPGCPGRARPGPAGRARSAPGRRRRRPPPPARSGPPRRRSPPARTPGASPPARSALPGPTITSTRGTDSVP